MPVYKPNPFKQFWHAFREWLPGAQAQVLETWEAIREEPAQIWNSVAFRCGMLALGGIILIVAARFTTSMLVPNAPDGHRQLSKTANFEVFCSNPSCKHHFLINKPFGYDRFPVKCPKCGKQTGERAVRCDSRTCQGRLVLPRKEGKTLVCSRCGAKLGSD